MQIHTDSVAPRRRQLDLIGAPAATPALVQRALGRRPRTALVNMPFVSISKPSIQLGLLRAIGAQHGFPIETFHLNLDFCAQLGRKAYEALCHHRGRMFGDWLFSLAAFDEQAPDPEDRLPHQFQSEVQSLLRAAGLPEDGLQLLRREAVPLFLSAARDSIAWRDFDPRAFAMRSEVMRRS